MAPRNFSEDGAIGAASPGETPSGGFGTGMQPSIMNGFMPQNNVSTPGTNEAGLGMGSVGDSAIADNGYNGSSWGGGQPDRSSSPSLGSMPAGRGGYGGFTPPPKQTDQVGDPYAAFTNNAISYAAGGAIDEDPNATDPQGSMMGANLQASINKAMGVVGNALAYGRKLHGISGGEQDGEAVQTAGRMPTQPGNPYGQQREQPMPGPLPPTNNPFGKRAEGEGDQQVAGMPSVPFSETPKPQPMPGPLPPTNNPFGKRADAGGGDEAISTDDEEMA